MKMLSALATLVGIAVAIIAAFVTLPVNVPMLLVLMGLLAGLAYDMDKTVTLMVAVLVYPVAGAALGAIPEVGGYLGAILTNVGVAAAGAAATVLTRRIIDMVKGSLAALTNKSA